MLRRIFPYRGRLWPGQLDELNVFEPDLIELVKDAYEDGEGFGVGCDDGLGCEVEVVDFNYSTGRLPDDEHCELINIRIIGRRRFRLVARIVPTDASDAPVYWKRLAEVEYIDDATPGTIVGTMRGPREFEGADEAARDAAGAIAAFETLHAESPVWRAISGRLARPDPDDPQALSFWLCAVSAAGIDRSVLLSSPHHRSQGIDLCGFHAQARSC